MASVRTTRAAILPLVVTPRGDGVIDPRVTSDSMSLWPVTIEVDVLHRGLLCGLAGNRTTMPVSGITSVYDVAPISPFPDAPGDAVVTPDSSSSIFRALSPTYIARAQATLGHL